MRYVKEGTSQFFQNKDFGGLKISLINFLNVRKTIKLVGEMTPVWKDILVYFVKVVSIYRVMGRHLERNNVGSVEIIFW